MTVSEVRHVLPECEVYSFREDASYIIVVDRNLVSDASIMSLVSSSKLQGIKATILKTDDVDCLKVLKVNEPIS